jgi:hypothetical protein
MRALATCPASRLVLVAALAWLSAPSSMEAQGRGSPATTAAGGRGGAPAARVAAPVDLTGYWAAVITEDWHVRMLIAPRGDFGSGAPGAIEIPGVGPIGRGANPSAQGNIPYNTTGAQAALKWDAAKDEAEGNACKAYGAAGIMRLPTQLHITWADESTLKVEADYGSQTRLFHFGPPPDTGRLDYGNATFLPPRAMKVDAPAVEPSWQGHSVASWAIMGGSGNFARGGHLKVVTSRLKPGYYWKNGMPYTSNAVLTEYFRVMQLPDRSQWIRFTQIVDDPEYLTQPWIVNYQFKKLPDGSTWNPTPCSVK